MIQEKTNPGNNDILPGFDDDACDSLTIGLKKADSVDNCLVVRPRGQLDSYSTHFFQRSLKRLIEAGFVNLVLQLDGVDYVSSMGVGAFVQLQRIVKEKGGEIALADVHPKVMVIFRLMCLDKLFACSDSLEEAVTPLKNKTPLFPRALACPICDKRLRVVKSGRFRCPECKTILSVSEAGAVSLA
jgi:anti-sigma B factor antagonist